MQTKSYQSMRSLSRSALGIAVLLAWSGGMPLSAAMLTLEPPTRSVAVGDPVEVAVRISDLGDGIAPSLGAFDLNFHFNPSLLSFDSVVVGDPVLGDIVGPVLGSMNGIAVDAAGGLINVFSLSLDDAVDLDTLQPADFILASVRFSAVNPGLGSFELSDVILGDALGAELIPTGLGTASVDIAAIVPPTAIPEMAPISSGFALLVLSMWTSWRLRRRQ